MLIRPDIIPDVIPEVLPDNAGAGGKPARVPGACQQPEKGSSLSPGCLQAAEGSSPSPWCWGEAGARSGGRKAYSYTNFCASCL